MTVRSTYRFARIPEWVLFHPDLDAVDTRVYGVLDRFSGDNGCFPGVARVAEIVGKSDDTVRRSLRKLEAVGAVATEARFADGRQTTNAYILAGDAPVHTRARVDAGDGARVDAGDGARVDAGPYREPEEREPEERTHVDQKVDDRFEEFWEAYPRKVAKKPAQTAWKRVKVAEREKAIKAARTLALLRKRGVVELRFIPHPATFIRAERWNDETPDAPVAKAERGFDPDAFMVAANEAWVKKHGSDDGWLAPGGGRDIAAEECARRMEEAGLAGGGFSTRVKF